MRCELIRSLDEDKPEGVRFVDKGVVYDYRFTDTYERYPILVTYENNKSITKEPINCEQMLSMLGYKVKNDKNVNSMLNIMDKMM